MLIKICGMRERSNISEITILNPDMMGFIFYPQSKRYVGTSFDPSLIPDKKTGIKSVAVFVNESIEAVQNIITRYKFDVVQLHGSESPEYCKKISTQGVMVWKAFGIHANFDWKKLEIYNNACDYFLFDTSTKDHGGSGKKFDWDILTNKHFNKPFFLSGGIGPEDALDLTNLNHPDFAGIDINSRFEVEPGLKNKELINNFLVQLRK